MDVKIEKVSSRAQMRRFVRFPYGLYKNCNNWVPALEGDEYDTFNPEKNGAYEYCSAECYLAVSEGRDVGRVAAIINNKANEKWDTAVVRFGWLDFIEDKEVLLALLGAVESYGKEHGCTLMKGPWGFTDMDKEGLLVEGFENLSPFTCLYNYPYYDNLLKECGFRKDVDWTQKVLKIEKELPPYARYADLVQERYGLHIAECSNMQELRRKYGMDLFHMVNESFAALTEFCPLSDRQIESYLDTYVPILNPDFVSICLDENEKPVGFAFCVPTLSNAVKKSRGKLFPLGFLRILRALRKNDTLEALMIGVLPEYQGKGASLLILKRIHENCIKNGVTRIILNPQLEHNTKVQTLFSQYEMKPFMRRRAYARQI